MGPPLPPKCMASANALNPKFTKTIDAFARIKSLSENASKFKIKIGR